MPSRLVITFLSRSKHLLISWLQSSSAVILEPRKIKSATVSTVSPSICHEVMGPDAMNVLVLLMLILKPTFSLSPFNFIKRLFRSSSLSAIRVMSSAYLRLLIFLQAILIPPCASSSPAFLMMCSAYKLYKQGDNIQPCCTPFPIWNQSVLPCLVLTVASWPVVNICWSVAKTFCVWGRNLENRCTVIKRAINLCLQAVQYVVFYYSGLNRLRNDTNDHGSGDNLFEILVSIFWINNKKWNCWSIWYSTFNFLRNIHPVFHSSCTIFIPTNDVQIFCSFCIHIVFSFSFFF